MGHAAPRLRIAVLECDEPIGRTKERYGGYGALFEELLHAGAAQLAHELPGKEAAARVQLDVTKYDVVNAELYPRLEEVDALLLTGSKHNAFDNDPWILRLVEYMRGVLAQRRVRTVGVCFGHQILGRAMDAKVDRSDAGWEVAVVDVDLTAKGREVLGMEALRIHQMHRDIVYELPPGIEALGSTARCAVQGMYARGRLLSVQGHPEFTGDIETELLGRRHEQGIFDDAMYDEAMTRVRNGHDGVAVAAAFLRFLLDAREEE